MPEIYTDFAAAFRGFNDVITADDSVITPVGRAYLRPAPPTQEIRPYYDEIHWEIYYELWFRLHTIRDRLAADPSYHGHIYGGCAGNVNLDYMTATKAPAAILFDINPLQTLFWQDVFNLAVAHKDRFAFAKAFQAYPDRLYYNLEDCLGTETIAPFMRPPESQKFGRFMRSSPFRGMDYGDVERWLKFNLQSLGGVRVGSTVMNAMAIFTVLPKTTPSRLLLWTYGMKKAGACWRTGWIRRGPARA